MASDPKNREPAKKADLLITGAEWVITMDPDRRLIRDGAVAIGKDRILAVGKTADLKTRYSSARTLEAKDKIVLPALINTHLHHTQQLGVMQMGVDKSGKNDLVL